MSSSRRREEEALLPNVVEFESPSKGGLDDKDIGHAKQQSSPQRKKRNPNNHQGGHGPPSSTAAAAAAAANYEYQQQQAAYAQQFYQQQQQQRYPGYVPWPAPGNAGGVQGVPTHPFFTPNGGFTMQQMQQQQQQPQQQHPRRTSGNDLSTINATLSQGSDQDDEYVALLQKNLAQVGGYGSLGANGNNNNGRISPALSNTSSNGKRPSSRSASGGNANPPPPPPKSMSKIIHSGGKIAKPKHRRAQSDSYFNPNGGGGGGNKPHPLKRTTTTEKPPMAVSKSPRFPDPGSRKTAQPSPKTHSRSRSLSSGGNGGGIIGGLPAGLQHQRPSHRRSYSNASSVGAGSVASEASFVTHTTDIRKSAYFHSVDKETGNAQLHYPNEHIFVCTDDPGLTNGKVYKVADYDEEAFEEYHRQAEDAMWEEEALDDEERRRRRDPFGALPSNKFALAVDSTVYKRVLDEISQADSMPCGLFFCGHHEDVAYPSVGIAVVAVTILFASMGYAAFSFGMLS